VGQTHHDPGPNPLERGLWRFGLFFGLLIGAPFKRQLSKEWARTGPWTIGQIDTSTYDQDKQNCYSLVARIILIKS